MDHSSSPIYDCIPLLSCTSALPARPFLSGLIDRPTLTFSGAKKLFHPLARLHLALFFPHAWIGKTNAGFYSQTDSQLPRVRGLFLRLSLFRGGKKSIFLPIFDCRAFSSCNALPSFLSPTVDSRVLDIDLLFPRPSSVRFFW